MPIPAGGQCSVSGVSITADSTFFCRAPFTVAFSGQATTDTTPVLLTSQTTTNNFQGPFTYNFPRSNNGCTYYLAVNGSAGLWLGTNRADAYAKFNGTNNQPYGPPGLSNWFLNILPDSGLSAYNPAHQYNLYYTGDGNTVTFSFFDNPYNDNSGQVSFQWFGIPCYRYDWDFGDGHTSALMAPIHTYSAAGTYTVRLRVTDLLSNCYEEATMTVVSTTAPAADLGADRSLCAGQTAILDPGVQGVTYNWQDNSSAATYQATATGLYTVVVSNGCGSHTDSLHVTFRLAPSIDLAADTFFCRGSTISIRPSLLAGEQVGYLWNDGTTSRELDVSVEGNYSVTASNDCGTDADSIEVTAEYCECRIILPTAFSPDQDGFNDTFLPFVLCELVGYRFSLYNRFGERLFYSEDPESGWDGLYRNELQPMDTYSYVIHYSFSTPDRPVEEDRITGQVMLLR
jgi:gliding motility-associated-like protein